MKLKDSLLSLCKARGWTLANLARKSGVPTQTLHGWTTGRKAVNLEHLAKVADVLGVPLYELVYGRPDPHIQTTVLPLEELFSGDVRITIHRLGKK